MDFMKSERAKESFGPLVFEENRCDLLQNVDTRCLLCEDEFNLQISLPMFLAHIFDVHNIVIEDVQNIANLHDYISYWQQKFKNTPIEQIIPSITFDSTNQKYFLMSNLLKEDKELRHNLKLEYALKVQEYERNDKSFIRFCLMCKLCYEDRHVLKEHMRKKLHKRINPENEEYDRFYIVNYLEPNKSWKTIQKEDDRYAISREVNADEEYSDWNEKEDQIICLFCKAKETDINVICQHMEAEHGFSFTDVTKDLDFFQKVKLINYIRKQIHENRCSYCQLKFETFDDLEKHLTGENHYKIPHLKTFDQPEFYFPTYENDAFLYLIDDVEDN
ncbi:zinc finger protein 277 isoform X2 [Diorhabda sublineata]|uniref:zinc finger protein 277 isoform X2 n=1 Tax=Diorhabda sublineata TaxID=1163346 RepID=UPI0024E06A5B|nr:zinc finger protein 277 isoform X2 [Diorhabda sublineata]